VHSDVDRQAMGCVPAPPSVLQFPPVSIIPPMPCSHLILTNYSLNKDKWTEAWRPSSRCGALSENMEHQKGKDFMMLS